MEKPDLKTILFFKTYFFAALVDSKEAIKSIFNEIVHYILGAQLLLTDLSTFFSISLR